MRFHVGRLWLFLLSVEIPAGVSSCSGFHARGTAGNSRLRAVLFFFGLPFVYLAIQFLFKRRRPSCIHAALVLLTVLFVRMLFQPRSRHLPPESLHPRESTSRKTVRSIALLHTLDRRSSLTNGSIPAASGSIASGITPEWLVITILPAFCILVFVVLCDGGFSGIEFARSIPGRR
jgi:hypothetical protein